jgi:GlpG protein
MRQIGKLPVPTATTLGDYLVTQGIGNEVEPVAGGLAAVWVLREDQLARARSILERFLLAPADPQWQDAATTAARVRQEEDAAEARRAANLRSPRAAWTARRRTYVTWSLIVASVAVSLITNFNENRAMVAWFTSDHAGAGEALFADVQHGQVWRLVTPIFLHVGFMHLLFNMMWLFTLGGMIEMRQGRTLLGVMVLVLALVSNAAQYLYAGPAFGGMSGVVYGLFGYIWIRGRLDPAIGFTLTRQDVILMMVWFVFCLTGILPVANACHAAGLLVGALWGVLSAPIIRLRIFGK